MCIYILLYLYTYIFMHICIYNPCWNSSQTWGFHSIGTKTQTQVEGGDFPYRIETQENQQHPATPIK